MKVLVAEDSLVYQKMLRDCLVGWGFEPISARDGRTAWDHLQADDSPRLALLDWVLPDVEGSELCRKLRQSEGRPYVYTILLTAKDRKDELIEGLEAGADDYLVKPFDPQELRVRLQTGSRLVRLQEELVAAQTALRDLASHDSLTGLWNRREILDFLRRELLRARRQRLTVSVIMADVDYFKKINDSFGHVAGDQVLTEVARRLRNELRAYDGIGRYGGEEFLLVLPGCDYSAATGRAEQLRRAVAAPAVRTTQDNLQVTISLGVAASISGDPGPEAVLELADAALYNAKQKGRNRVEGCPMLCRLPEAVVNG